jgi:hypothetical protein
MPSDVVLCDICQGAVDVTEAHSPTTAETLRDDWHGHELWHEDCCPYCKPGVGPLPTREDVEEFHPT